MVKRLGIVLGLVLVLLLVAVLFSFLSSSGGGNQSSKAVTDLKQTQKPERCLPVHIYALQFSNNQTSESLVVQRVIFKSLEERTTGVNIALDVSAPQRPGWLEDKSNFRLVQPASSTQPPQFSDISTPTQTAESNVWRVILRGVQINSEDVLPSIIEGRLRPPSSPIYLEISSFQDEPLMVGLTASGTCRPLNSVEALKNLGAAEAKKENKVQPTVKQKQQAKQKAVIKKKKAKKKAAIKKKKAKKSKKKG